MHLGEHLPDCLPWHVQLLRFLLRFEVLHLDEKLLALAFPLHKAGPGARGAELLCQVKQDADRPFYLGEPAPRVVGLHLQRGRFVGQQLIHLGDECLDKVGGQHPLGHELEHGLFGLVGPDLATRT
ncbi:MAG: hypothetical protein JXA14_24170 [Anaerolineae bacterium]|nr:hypothetical protein [Anaerolineae bacterium]